MKSRQWKTYGSYLFSPRSLLLKVWPKEQAAGAHCLVNLLETQKNLRQTVGHNLHCNKTLYAICMTFKFENTLYR